MVIFDLISNTKAGSIDFRILSQVEIFMQTLKAIRMNFDKKYRRFQKNKNYNNEVEKNTRIRGV